MTWPVDVRQVAHPDSADLCRRPLDLGVAEEGHPRALRPVVGLVAPGSRRESADGLGRLERAVWATRPGRCDGLFGVAFADLDVTVKVCGPRQRSSALSWSLLAMMVCVRSMSGHRICEGVEAAGG